jgi:hypothetical protein
MKILIIEWKFVWVCKCVSTYSKADTEYSPRMYSKLYSNLFTLGEIATCAILFEAFFFAGLMAANKKLPAIVVIRIPHV